MVKQQQSKTESKRYTANEFAAMSGMSFLIKQTIERHYKNHSAKTLAEWNAQCVKDLVYDFPGDSLNELISAQEK